MTHVLIVDDEPQILRALVLSLTHHGFEVSTAADARTALRLASTTAPDLLLLDLGLPDFDGLEVIRQLRLSDPDLPVVVLSARSGGPDKIVALDLGAIDYVTKPFDMNELLARVRAILRRTTAQPRPRTVELGAVHIDLDTHLVVRTSDDGPETIHLTPTEWRMVEVLLAKPGSLVTTKEMLTALRGAPGNTDNSYLRVFMAQLRRKLEREPSRPVYFITEPGMGYRFRPDAGARDT